MVLKLENVSYKYNKGSKHPVKAIDGISFTVEKGDFIGITGSTGSGKSTLVEIIAGLLRPAEGKITNEIGTAGIVFQYPEHQLFAETVIEDVKFGPRNAGFSDYEATAAAKNAMECVGLDESFEARNPLELSGGEKRLASIAGILALKPSVLILDEPSAGLDSVSEKRIFSIIKDLNKSGVTVIVVSHCFDCISEYCNKVAVIENGRIVEYGPVDRVKSIKTSASLLADELRKYGIDIPDGIKTKEQLIDEISKLL